MLACSVGAGLIQIALGLFQAGSLGLAFPTTVVHGMLASIGIIITAKQLYVLLGMVPLSSKPLEMLFYLPSQLKTANFAITIIGLSCLAIMIGLTFFSKRHPKLKFIPVPLVAVLCGIGFSLFFDLEHQHIVAGFMGHFKVGPTDLLVVPSQFFSAFYFPDFSEILSVSHLKHVFFIAFIASTESILSTCAVDQLDPLRRRSDLNRELTGKGLCNVVASLIGGLPMISEIVRSSANVANGAQSQKSNFFHGMFLLLFLMTIPQYLHMIPLAALGAILVFVGYQLCKPSHFIYAFKKGKNEGFVFVATILGILSTDILIGVLFGSIIELVLLMVRGRSFDVLKPKMSVHEDTLINVIEVNSPLVFKNFLSFRSIIEKCNHKSLIIDLKKSSVVDSTVLGHLNHYKKDFESKEIDFIVHFSDPHISRHGDM
jgi:MFS superfamily sulfate permease-like transporter